MQQLQISLNANGVAAPAQRAAWQCCEIVTFCLQSAVGSDLSKQPEIVTNALAYRFTGPDMSAAERFGLYENWMLSKGFQELARGVRESLEEAIFYLELLKVQQTQTTWGEFQAKVAAIRRRAGRLLFPALMAEVNAGLTATLTFADEFTSFQKVRNCLEHRGGTVGTEDVDHAGNLTLTLPRLKMFYVNPAGEEIELAPGVIIDTHEHTGLAEILIKRETRARTYALGEKVAFNAAEFGEIAFACHLFANDLATKLPTLPASA
ncbi:hypothetical protein [Bradyrhizobium pachyrhizi]|uniref:hypothetical protein n=1 Tax=Bradyrhizobium pachyrhizi TaxID=280333 RepID=UPI00067A9BF2|nr:hypothetical protein [Bradyrhizobium pachyrhizi]